MESFAESLPRRSTGTDTFLHNYRNNDNNDHSIWMLRHDAGRGQETKLSFGMA